jgi:threonyl-tRNA synthetase
VSDGTETLAAGRQTARAAALRLADFGRLHRYERSGVTHGLSRVRTFSQDDAHIFCTLEQMGEEIKAFFELLYEVYGALGMTDVKIRLATRPDKRIGTDEQWDLAEKALSDALTERGLAFDISPGEGAFYGPKLEFHIEDALRRTWQLGTIQVDYALPDRFDLEYTSTVGTARRPVMLHRAILGSVERMIAILTESYAGKWPLWLSPRQVAIVPIALKYLDYAQRVAAAARGHGSSQGRLWRAARRLRHHRGRMGLRMGGLCAMRALPDAALGLLCGRAAGRAHGLHRRA